MLDSVHSLVQYDIRRPRVNQQGKVVSISYRKIISPPKVIVLFEFGNKALRFREQRRGLHSKAIGSLLDHWEGDVVGSLERVDSPAKS